MSQLIWAQAGTETHNTQATVETSGQNGLFSDAEQCVIGLIFFLSLMPLMMMEGF